MKIKIALWVAAVFICLQSSLASDDCNEYADKILNQMKEEKDFFQEPYEILDGKKTFGIYELELCTVFGLSTLHRMDHVIPLKSGKTGDRFIKVFLGAGVISIHSSIKRRILHLGKSVNVKADIPLITMELEVVPKPDGTEPVIKNFKVHELKGLKYKVYGAGVIKDFFLNAFSSGFGVVIKKMVKADIEHRLNTFLGNKVNDLTIPEKCLKDAWD